MPAVKTKKPTRAVSVLAAMCTLVLPGCSALPGMGPGMVDVATQGAPTADREGYLVAPLDARVAAILARRGDTSLRGHFGDNKPAPDQRIGVGDVLQVTIWEAGAGGLFSAPAFDRLTPGSRTASIPEQIVARDGAITIPYAGRIQVAGMTAPTVEARIMKALDGKAIEPQVLVAITRNLANTATVAGEVMQGARVPLSPRGDRILDVLASAGGVRSPAHDSFITLTRQGRSIRQPMQMLLDDPRENIFVQPGDTLTVERIPQSFTAFGAAGRNAVVPFEAPGLTLEEAIAKAGGLSDSQADPQGVFLLRIEQAAIAREVDPAFPIPPGKTWVEVVYRVNLRDPNAFFLARRFRVHDKDILYVASSPLTDAQKILSIVAPAANTAYMLKISGK